MGKFMNDINKRTILSSATIFLIRRRVVEYLNKLEKVRNLSTDEIEDIADKLLEYGEYALPVIVRNFSKLKEPTLIERYEHLMMYMYEPDFLKYLVNLNLKENLYIRKSLLSLLNFYGFDIAQSSLHQEIEEYYFSVQDALNEILQESKPDFKKLSSFLKGLYFLSDDEKLRLLSFIDNSKSAIKYFLYYTFFWTGSQSLIFDVIKNLGKTRKKEAYALLLRAKKILPYHYHQEIERNLRKLVFSGVGEGECNFRFEANVLRTMISNPNRDDKFFIFFEILHENKIKLKFLFSVIDCYFFSIDCYFYGSEESSLEMVYGLREVNSKMAFDILCDIILNHFEKNVLFPWQFSLFALFMNCDLIIPKNYTCNLKIKEEPVINNYLYKVLEMIIEENEWLIRDYRFIEIVEKWYLNTEPYEDLWRDHLFLRKVIREIIIPELDLWKKRFCQLGDYLYYVDSQHKLSFIIHKILEDLHPDVEIIEKDDFIKKLIMYNKNRYLNQKGRQL